MTNNSDLLGKIQKGDWDAFELLFRKNVQPLYNYAISFIKDENDAEDIVQDAFVYLWLHRNKINNRDSAHVYLLRSVRNACLNYKMHKSVQDKYKFHVAKQEQNAETEYDWDALREKVMGAVDRLPAKCREIFIMGCIDGMKYQNIADIKGISVNTVKTQMRLAFGKLRSDFGNMDDILIIVVLSKIFLQ